MCKFFVLALVAAAVALAAANVLPEDSLDAERSELSLNPDDDHETDKLKGTNLEGFRDFCINTRDTVISDLKNRGNIFASDVFAGIFRSFGEIAQSSLTANAKATERLSKQLANPGAEIEAGDSEIDRIIAEGQQKIKEAGTQPQGILAAFVSGIKGFASAGYGQVVEKISSLQKELGNRSVSKSLIDFCEQLSTYESKAIEIFEDTKTSLMAEDADQYKNVKYSDVAPKCVTANRLSRAEGLCKFVMAAKGPLAKTFAGRLPTDSSEQ